MLVFNNKAICFNSTAIDFAYYNWQDIHPSFIKSQTWNEGIDITSADENKGGLRILLVNEIMKSEYYGVYGNHQENLINLFRYNDLYGSMSLCSPKTIMLAPGEYGDGYTLYNANGKRVIFSKGASIKTGNTVRCESYEGTGVIGKLICNCPARLSNFRELSDFLNCGSSTLIFDK